MYNSDGELLLDSNGEKIQKFNSNGIACVKNPKLSEAYYHLFKETPNGRLHDSLVDVAVCLRIFIKLNNDIDIFSNNFIKDNMEIYNIINPDKDISKIKSSGRKRRSKKKL
jgi:hypothetical protein